MSAKSEPLKPLRTWSHLTGPRRRRPSEYEIVSTNLMYDAKNAESPFELGPNIPLSKWFKKHRHGSPLTGRDWEEFRDPDELTYRAYNILQDGQETYIEGLFDQHNELQYDAGLAAAWVAILPRLYTPARYAFHTRADGLALSRPDCAVEYDSELRDLSGPRTPCAAYPILRIGPPS